MPVICYKRHTKINMKDTKKQMWPKNKGGGARESNFELLRIVGALLVVAHHFAGKSGAVSMTSGLNRIWACLMYAGGQLGVNVFVLLGAYFLTNEEFRFIRIVRIWIETMFYSVSIGLLCVIFQIPNADISRDVLLKGLFPIFGYPYWFVSAYLGMLLCTPFLNFFIGRLSKRLYQYMLWIMTIFLSIIPSVMTWTTAVFGNNIIWFIYLYFLIGYGKKYGMKIKQKNAVFIFLCSYTFIWLTEIIFPIYGRGNLVFASAIGNLQYYYINKHTFPMLVASVSLFCIFLNIKIQHYGIINRIASTTLGIYLIHTHSSIKEKVIWENFFCASNWFASNWFIFQSLFCVITVFAVCCFVDLVRIKTLERWIINSKYVNRICNKIDTFIKIDDNDS